MAAGKKGSARWGKVQFKKSINLMLAEEKKENVPMSMLLLVLIVVGAVLFSKFFVIDRMAEASRIEGLANAKKAELDRFTEALSQFDGVEDEYAHYTYTGMTDQELGLVDRISILELIESILPAEGGAASWNVSGNQVTMEVTGDTLEDINLLRKQLEESPIVNSVSINSANTTVQNVKNVDESIVRARITVYLQKPKEEVAQ